MKNMKSAQLVFQHLENISRDALEQYQKIIKQYVHRQSGVYALYNNSKLYYVGLASNLNSRLKHHLNDRHADTWDRFSVYLTQGDSHLREIEALLLRIASPKGNRQMGKLKRSENLKNRFGKDMNAYYKRVFHDMFTHKTEEDELRPRNPKRNIGAETRGASLAPYVRKRMHIRFEYKGNRYVAHVRRDGTITFGSESHRAKQLMGPVYTSPSLAGKAITGVANDGWMSWKYKNSSGEWVKLNELRKNAKEYRL
jgi:hypothetical protein